MVASKITVALKPRMDETPARIAFVSLTSVLMFDILFAVVLINILKAHLLLGCQ